MAAVISVDAYPFLALSDLTCHLEDTGIGFLVALVGSSDQEASPSAGKNIGIVLVLCSSMEMHPYSYF